MSRKNVRVRAGAPPLIFNGSFNSGDFRSYVREDGTITMSGMPWYGTPVDYGGPYPQTRTGTSECMWLTSDGGTFPYKSGPTLSPHENHAVAVRIKSEANEWADAGYGSYTRDSSTQFTVNGADARLIFGVNRPLRFNGSAGADVTVVNFSGGNTVVTVSGEIPTTISLIEYNMRSISGPSGTQYVIGDWDNTFDLRRRAELRAYDTLWETDALPYGSHRWLSCSMSFDASWPTTGIGSITMWQFKSQINHNSMSPIWSFGLVDGTNWRLRHRNEPSVENAITGSVAMDLFHTTTGSLTQFFPNETVSKAMMTGANIGGWNHWVVEALFDARTSTAGGVGFFKMWMRRDLADKTPDPSFHTGVNDWKLVAHWFATPTNGVGYLLTGTQARHGMLLSNYAPGSLGTLMALPVPGALMYYANVKVGNENTLFSAMSHDGSAPV